jgi:hypothetical protein
MPALTIENAIHAELVTASGLAGDRIIYEYQNRDALGKDTEGAREFMTLHYRGGGDVSPAHPIETIRDNPDATVPTPGVAGDGDELLIGTITDEEFFCRVMFHAGPVTGGASAYDRLKRTVRKLGLESVGIRLAAAGVVFVEPVGEIQSVPVVLETEYESQAFIDLRFRNNAAEETEETFIETATFEGTFTGTNSDE